MRTHHGTHHGTLGQIVVLKPSGDESARLALIRARDHPDALLALAAHCASDTARPDAERVYCGSLQRKKDLFKCNPCSRFAALRPNPALLRYMGHTLMQVERPHKLVGMHLRTMAVDDDSCFPSDTPLTWAAMNAAFGNCRGHNYKPGGFLEGEVTAEGRKCFRWGYPCWADGILGERCIDKDGGMHFGMAVPLQCILEDPAVHVHTDEQARLRRRRRKSRQERRKLPPGAPASAPARPRPDDVHDDDDDSTGLQVLLLTDSPRLQEFAKANLAVITTPDAASSSLTELALKVAADFYLLGLVDSFYASLESSFYRSALRRSLRHIPASPFPGAESRCHELLERATQIGKLNPEVPRGAIVNTTVRCQAEAA